MSLYWDTTVSEHPPAELPSEAEVSYRHASGSSASLRDPQRLSSPHGLWRCRVVGGMGLPKSVIVKQVTTTEFTVQNDLGVSPRLLNEWAALQFLESLAVEGPWPGLLAGSRAGSLVILEDLGAHPTVQDLLLGNRSTDAVQILGALGSGLGALHSAARDHTAEFINTRREIGAEAPMSDSTRDVRTVAQELRDCFDFFDITPPTRFWSEVDLVETEIHTPGVFHTLIHADAGPQNFIWTGSTARLIDYEFATHGYGPLDLVSARLGFPHSQEGHTVPSDVVDVIEQEYRRAVRSNIPEVEDERLFRRSLTDACAHWALSRCATSWRQLFIEQETHQTDQNMMRRRSQVYTVFERFIDASRATSHRQPIALAVRELTEVVRRRHPTLTTSPIYPALEAR